MIAGEIVAGPHVRNACRRHLRDLSEGPRRGLTWDLGKALRAIAFFPDVLRLSQGRFDGVPFVLHPPQAFIVGSLFGWTRVNDEGRTVRRFRRVYIETSKGSGKSPLAAGIGLYCLVADGEAQAQVYSAASMKAQARVVFDFAVRMWKQSPALQRKLTPTGQMVVHNLADFSTGSYFRPVSSDEGRFSGPMPSCSLCDELHEHPNGDIIEMLERGFKSRAQPFLIMITNSGSDRNSVCWREHVNAIEVAAGTRDIDAAATFVGDPIDDATFSFVCGLDIGDDALEDEGCWVKANPMLGVTFPLEEMRRIAAQAKAIPGKLNNILRLHMCEWTDSDVAWMARPTLEAVLDDFEPLVEHKGEDVYVGLDLSATQDLTAAAFVVPTGRNDEGQSTFDAWVEAWTPADTLKERALRDKAPYDIWRDEGWLRATPGKVIGFEAVAASIAEAVGLYRVKALAYDRYGFQRHFEPQLDALGLTDLPIVEHPQGGKKKGADSGLWMPGSKLTLESLILEKRIRIRRSPVITSACMSAAVEGDAFGNFWFSKRKATNRIDALVALAMAVGAAAMNAPDHKREYQLFFA